MSSIAVALIAVLLVGCSSQPTSMPTTHVSPGTAAAPAAPVASLAPASAAAAPKVVAGSAAEQKQAPPGYKAIKRDGQMFYCKRDSQIGTRFTKVTCMTPDELAEYERDGAALRQELQRRANICNSPNGNCGDT
ncbi:MAG TPA: hypothetical protein VF851_07425 [Steroidobacteraceae bacterium]